MKRRSVLCSSAACHTSKTTFLFDSCPQQSDKQLISLVTAIYWAPSPHACSVKDFNDGKHVRFATWGLSLPQMSWIFGGAGAVRGSCPLMKSHDFLSWPSSAPTLPLSFSLSLLSLLLLLHLTDAGVELSSSNPLKERKQELKKRLDIPYKKEQTHNFSESLPIVQVE